MTERYMVPAVVSAVRILEALGQPGRSSARQIELAQELGLSKSTAHNLLSTLEEVGFVRRDKESRQYRLGVALVPLGRAAASHVRIAALASARIAPMSHEHGLSFAVAQLTDDGRAQVIDRAYPSTGLFVGITLGDRFGYFGGAIGKCLLACLPPDEAAVVVAGAPEIPARTPATITTCDELLAEVGDVRRQGWAASMREFNENNAVAAPVYGPSGKAELILLALGFTSQLPDVSVERIGALLRDTADGITAACGGRSPEFSVAGGGGASATGLLQAQEISTT